jgi:hypothetical protein
MAKITDSQYFLPNIQPLIAGEVLDSGKSKPLIINGICTKSYGRSEYVVKLRSSPELGVEASCRELIASFVAMELDLFVAAPAIIDLSAEFVETLKGRDCYPTAQISHCPAIIPKFFHRRASGQILTI